MCGIAGIFNFDKEKTFEEWEVRKMISCISHRGPDGEGVFVENNVALGHRRLSIIDLSTGDQPMISDDGNIVLIFNGEIYNYIELREELKKLDYNFKTTSDTEVIIKSYQEWGLQCQEKFNGMWAFALWDKGKQQLLLSRDKLGEKPLYFSISNNNIVFGSEIKSILEFTKDYTVNHEVLELYLTFGYVPAPYSFYKSISKLLPGHYLLIDNNKNISQREYWNFVQEIDESLKPEYVYENFASLFEDSVRIRMRSDVPFGAFLSGGLDSSSVVAMMSKISKNPIETFTIGFEDKHFDERAIARDVAEKFKTNHHEYLVVPETFENSVKKILTHYDEPFGDSSAIPTGHVSNFARKNVKMVLTGDGGDEVLSGYTIYQGEKFAGQYLKLPSLVRRSVPKLISASSVPFSGNLRYKLNRAARVLEQSNYSFEERLLAKISWVDPSILNSIIPSSLARISAKDYIEDIFKQCQYKDPFYKLMYFNLKCSLPDDMLTKVDRMSMASSLETRIPFLDPRLVEFMVKVPKTIKMEKYERKTVLRKSIGKELPNSVLKAGKKGFGVPLREWFKDSSFENRLKELYQQDFGLNSNIVKSVILENKEGKQDHGNFIWMLYILKQWLKKD